MEELDKNVNLTEEEFMNEMYKEVAEAHAERDRQNLRIINAVKQFMGKEWSDEFVRYLHYEGDEVLDLEECDENYILEDYSHFHFTKKPAGKQYNNERFSLIKPYTNQTVNGGMTGDDFAGTISVFLKEGKYLTWHYSC